MAMRIPNNSMIMLLNKLQPIKYLLLIYYILIRYNSLICGQKFLPQILSMHT